jgi:hypothetical protein
MQIEHDGSARIKFDAIDLRPRALVKLAPFHLYADADLADSVLRANWEATSTSVDGVASGSLPIRVAQEKLELGELLRANDPPEVTP